MLGLVNHAFEAFVRDTYGLSAWQAATQRALVPFDRFEPLLPYPDDMTVQVVAAAADVLNRTDDTLLEDFGTWLVSGRSGERLRRLLRFGGAGFIDFLFSLEELPDRVLLALPDFRLPSIRVIEGRDGMFQLFSGDLFPGAHHLMIGTLRAMADDYGSLVLIDGGPSEIRLQLLDARHASGRAFTLAMEAS